MDKKNLVATDNVNDSPSAVFKVDKSMIKVFLFGCIIKIKLYFSQSGKDKRVAFNFRLSR